ncbi:hypothetical protein [Kitasatospora sp. MAP5-34]|uniref:hypothetical protein n=1 Tax=Kitasatospora sp. MAP5-34 TaxID=3035102 RepID=UPI002476944F|nr:hypothetical protein [Kitasatospora sp. MAP5-34]MDH6576502.1 hypothetical protein [Kitasatospora sp. MAP5-34]
MTALIEPQMSAHPSWTLVHAGGGDRRYDTELWTSPLPDNEVYVHYRWLDHDIQQSVSWFACPRVTWRGVWDKH